MNSSTPKARQITTSFLAVWRDVLTRSELTTGCAVLAVTVATDSPDLLSHAATVFRAWRELLADLLRAGGHPEPDAFAALLVAASEGAVVLSRAEKSLEPFDLVVQGLLSHV